MDGVPSTISSPRLFEFAKFHSNRILVHQYYYYYYFDYSQERVACACRSLIAGGARVLEYTNERVFAVATNIAV